jgi:hypothetical protein
MLDKSEVNQSFFPLIVTLCNTKIREADRNIKISEALTKIDEYQQSYTKMPKYLFEDKSLLINNMIQEYSSIQLDSSIDEDITNLINKTIKWLKSQNECIQSKNYKKGCANTIINKLEEFDESTLALISKSKTLEKNPNILLKIAKEKKIIKLIYQENPLIFPEFLKSALLAKKSEIAIFLIIDLGVKLPEIPNKEIIKLLDRGKFSNVSFLVENKFIKLSDFSQKESLQIIDACNWDDWGNRADFNKQLDKIEFKMMIASRKQLDNFRGHLNIIEMREMSEKIIDEKSQLKNSLINSAKEEAKKILTFLYNYNPSVFPEVLKSMLLSRNYEIATFLTAELGIKPSDLCNVDIINIMLDLDLKQLEKLNLTIPNDILTTPVEKKLTKPHDDYLIIKTQYAYQLLSKDHFMFCCQKGAAIEELDLASPGVLASPEIVKKLIDDGRNVNQQLKTDNGECKLLHFAAIHASKESFILLMRAGAKIDIQDSLGRTPLHYAAANTKMELLKCLIIAGADFDMCDKNQQTALHRTTIKGGSNFFCAKILLHSGANPKLKDIENKEASEYITQNPRIRCYWEDVFTTKAAFVVPKTNKNDKWINYFRRIEPNEPVPRLTTIAACFFVSKTNGTENFEHRDCSKGTAEIIEDSAIKMVTP